MIRLVQALLSGVFFTFILDFFLFLGVKLHYIDYYGIDLYYNILFADNQCWSCYLISTLFIGYITTYYPKPRQAALVVGLLFATSLTTLIPPVGNGIGKFLLVKPDQTLQDQRFTYHGDVYYDGRDDIYILDDELNRIVKIMKKDLTK